MAIKTHIIKRKKRPFLQRLYLPYIIVGMIKTLSHFLRNLSDTSKIKFLEYPEQIPSDITRRYRGIHRLTKTDEGKIKCVACDMCATVCPANCIFITAAEIDDNIEKAPIQFTIDLLECVFCGFCVEACPKDAIRMDSGIFTRVGNTRESFLADILTLSNTKEGNF